MPRALAFSVSLTAGIRRITTGQRQQYRRLLQPVSHTRWIFPAIRSRQNSMPTAPPTVEPDFSASAYSVLGEWTQPGIWFRLPTAIAPVVLPFILQLRLQRGIRSVQSLILRALSTELPCRICRTRIGSAPMEQ